MAPRTGTSRNRLRPSGEIRSHRTAGTKPVVVGRSSTVTVRFDGPVTAASPDEHGRQLDCRRPRLLVVRASTAMARGYLPSHLSTIRSLLWRRVGTALEPGRAEVDVDVVLRDVCQAGIGVRGGDRSARKLVEVDLQRGKKALQVRLLVGSEGHVATADEREGLWKQVV